MVYIDWSEAQKKRTPAERKKRIQDAYYKINATEKNAKWIASHPTHFGATDVARAKNVIQTKTYSDFGKPKPYYLTSSAFQKQKSQADNKLLDSTFLLKKPIIKPTITPPKGYVNPLAPTKRFTKDVKPTQLKAVYDDLLLSLEVAQAKQDNWVARSFFRTARMIWGIPKDMTEGLEGGARGLYYLSKYVEQGKTGEAIEELGRASKEVGGGMISNYSKHPEDIVTDGLFIATTLKIAGGGKISPKARTIIQRTKVSPKAPSIYKGIVNKIKNVENPKFSARETNFINKFKNDFNFEMSKNQGQINQILKENNLGKYMDRDYAQFIAGEKLNLKPSRSNLWKEMKKQKMSKNEPFKFENPVVGEPPLLKNINTMTLGELDFMTKVLKQSNKEGVFWKQQPLKEFKTSQRQIDKIIKERKIKQKAELKKWNERVENSKAYERQLQKQAKQQKGLEKTKTLESLRKLRKKELDFIKSTFKNDIVNGKIAIRKGIKFELKSIGKLTEGDIAILFETAGKQKVTNYFNELKKINKEVKTSTKKTTTKTTKKTTRKTTTKPEPTKSTGDTITKQVVNKDGTISLVVDKVKVAVEKTRGKPSTRVIQKVKIPSKSFNLLTPLVAGSVISQASKRDKVGVRLLASALVPVEDLTGKSDNILDEDLTEKEEITKWDEIIEQAKELGITLATIGAITLMPGGAKVGGSVESSGNYYGKGYKQLKKLPKKYQVSLGGLVLGRKTTSVPMEVSGTGIRPLLVRGLPVKKMIVRKKAVKRRKVKKKAVKKRAVKKVKRKIKKRVVKRKVKKKTTKKRVVKKRKTKKKVKKRRK